MTEHWSPFNELRFRIEVKIVGWIPWIWLCHYFMCLLYPEDINEGGGILWFLKLRGSSLTRLRLRFLVANPTSNDESS